MTTAERDRNILAERAGNATVRLLQALECLEGPGLQHCHVKRLMEQISRTHASDIEKPLSPEFKNALRTAHIALTNLSRFL